MDLEDQSILVQSGSGGKIETGFTMGFYHEPTEETPVDFLWKEFWEMCSFQVVLGMLRGR